jgi:hypothetical protein
MLRRAVRVGLHAALMPQQRLLLLNVLMLAALGCLAMQRTL